MILKNTKLGAKYNLDQRMKHLIDFKSTVELTDSEIDLFGKSTALLANHGDFIKLRERIVTVIFSGSNTFSLSFPEDVFGSQGCFIYINYSKWTALDDTRKIICLLEEFVHHFWDTSDEIETSRIVTSFFKNLDYDKTTGEYKGI